MTTTKERLKQIAQAIENERMSSVTIQNQVEEAWKQGVHDAIRQVRWRQSAVSEKLKPLYDELVTVMAAMAVRGEYEMFSYLDSEWVGGPYVDAGEGEGITFEKAEVVGERGKDAYDDYHDEIARVARGAPTLGMHKCPNCGKPSRNSTAGCDHCDLEDK